MESQIRIKFWLNKAKKNQKNLVPIYLRVTFNYDYFIRSTGLMVKESDWDKRSMRARGLSTEATIINSRLEGLKIKVHQIISQLTGLGRPFTIYDIRETLEGKGNNQITLMKITEEHLDLLKRLKGKEYEKSTIIKYENTTLRLAEFLKHKFNRTDIFLYELNDNFLWEFEFFLKETYGNNTTTCYKHYQRFTRIIRMALQKGYMDKYPFREYKIRPLKKRIEYLDRVELGSIEKLELRIERLVRVKDIFVFCCYSGLAYNEVYRLTSENIITGIDGEKWMQIHRKKTKKDYQVPILPKASEILEKYSNHPICIKRNVLLPVTSNVKMNAYLKEIGDLYNTPLN